mgnify:CR=1 FL=1
MWDFVSEHGQGLNVVLNLAMVVVWVLYFQLLLNGRRRELRAKILINRSAGDSLAGNCIVSNMGNDPIYIERVAITLQPDGEVHALSLTDLDSLQKTPERDARAAWFQGPLMTGEYVNLGSFEQLFETLANAGALPEGIGTKTEEIDCFELSVLAEHGPDDKPVAAVRTFWREEGSGARSWRSSPTRQVRSRRERARLSRELHHER